MTRTPPARWTIGVGVVLAFACTWMLRWVTVVFVNDHFTHLSRARQIVAGELPIRDFFDPGQFLHYYLSAAAQVAFGYNLFGEALLTITFVASAAAITYWLSVRLSRSWRIAAAATFAAVLMLPRLYNYPKVFLYVTAIALAWSYAARPTRARVSLLAAMTVLAFLFRYDHGFYIGFFMAVLLTLVHIDRWREGLRAFGVYAAVASVLLLPFLVYVQWATGLLPYIRGVLIPARTIATSVESLKTPAFGVHDSAPLVEIAPSSRIPDVLPGTALWRAIDRRVPIFRLRIAPGVFSATNALVWLYYFTMLLPFLALLMCIGAWWRGSIDRAETVVIAATACLCIVTSRTLLSDNPEARLPDTAFPTAVLAAWVAGRLVAAQVQRGIALRRWGLLLVFAATLWSVTVHADVIPTVGHGLRTLEWHPIATISNRLHQRPIDAWAPREGATGLMALGRYVMRCTLPTDRLLVAGTFAPEVYFYTERLFAAGQVHFLAGWHVTDAEQRQSVEWLRRQSVPIAIVGPEPLFPLRFTAVRSYLDSQYEEVARSTFGGDVEWRVLGERGRTPVGTDAQLGLPCYARP